MKALADKVRLETEDMISQLHQYEQEILELQRLILVDGEDQYSDLLDHYTEKKKEIEFTLTDLRHSLFLINKAEKRSNEAIDKAEAIKSEPIKKKRLPL